MNTPCYFSPALSRAVAVLGLALGLAVLPGCGAKDASPTAATSMPAKSVSVATAISRDVPQYLDADGLTSAFQSVSIVSQVEGQIVDMPFQQGSMVKKGDKLAVIFQPPFQAAVDKAAGQVASDEANLKLAEAVLEHNKALLPDKYISQQQYDTYAAQVDALKGQLQQDQATLTTATINLNYATITAPVDGMVGNYRINVGNVVKVNDLPITTIQTLNPMYADFVISESEFPALRERFDANGGKLNVHVVSLSDAKAQQDGELAILGNAVGASTGTVSLRATLPNDRLLFWPNQPIHVRILLDTVKDSVLVPESAIMLSQQGEFVFVVTPGQKAGDLPTATMRIVQSGQVQDDGTKVITSGLKAGEQVVVEGQIFLAPGMPLNITTADNVPTAAAASATATAAQGTTTAAPATSATKS